MIDDNASNFALENNGFETIAVQKTAVVDASLSGKRIDQVASEQFAEFSREQLKAWLQSGELRLNGQQVKPKQRVKHGDKLELDALITRHSEDRPEAIPLTIVYEDEAVIVVNKPAGLVVHPGAGNPTGTLVNALLHHNPQQAALPRAGIVHRIDKDTSGLLVVGKTSAAQQHLMAQLKKKRVYRQYTAVVLGHPESTGTVEAPIGRHPKDRIKMAVVDTGKSATSHYQVVRTLLGSALMSVSLETGRTHQIRVHMAHLGHPLIGDPVYGSKQRPKAIKDDVFDKIINFERQALHAHRLGFVHPLSLAKCQFEAPLPDDMSLLISALSSDQSDATH